MGSFYMEATQINYRRDEALKTVDQKLQELSETSAIDTDIAPVFKSTNTYAPGDLVYYRNKLYRFNVEHTGAWAAGDVSATDVTTAINNAAAVKADEADIAPAFDATASYTAGDLVYYGGIIYRCTNDHSGDWDADDFSATTISAEIDSLKSGLTNLGESANMSNWNDYPDFEGKYAVVGKVLFFSLKVTKADSSWNLAGIANRQVLINGAFVAYDNANSAQIIATNTSGSIVLQIQDTNTFTNPTNVSGCFLLA